MEYLFLPLYLESLFLPVRWFSVSNIWLDRFFFFGRYVSFIPFVRVNSNLSLSCQILFSAGLVCCSSFQLYFVIPTMNFLFLEFLSGFLKNSYL